MIALRRPPRPETHTTSSFSFKSERRHFHVCVCTFKCQCPRVDAGVAAATKTAAAITVGGHVPPRAASDAAADHHHRGRLARRWIGFGASPHLGRVLPSLSLVLKPFCIEVMSSFHDVTYYASSLNELTNYRHTNIRYHVNSGKSGRLLLDPTHNKSEI